MPLTRVLDMTEQYLAVNRLTKLITEDEITHPLRHKVTDWATGYPTGSFRERVEFAVNCGACSSVWASAVVGLMSRTKLGRVGVKILAGSAAALLVDAVVTRLDH